MADFDLDAFLPYQLSVLAGRVSRDFARLYHAAYGISVPEWRVIAHLSQAERVSVREIHARVDMDKSKVSRAAARLEAAGYIVKVTAREDRRLVELSLTCAGRAMIDDLAHRAAAYERELIDALGADGPALRAQLSRLLDIVAAREGAGADEPLPQERTLP